MSSIINKRQQARNERILQDLLKSVAGNDRCADCGTKNPAWASWSIGVFLCIRCASLHRKLGTHISKVKSISMDSWTPEQIDNMRANGNTKSNLYYNPDPKKHPVPLNTEDSVGVLERYIRNKYEYQLFRREDAPKTSSTSSVSSSSLASTNTTNGLSLPSSSSSNASFQTTPSQRSASGSYTSSRLGPRATSPSQKKVSQVLGVSTIPYTDTSASGPVQFPHGMVQASPAAKYEDQLKALREMGFKDDKQSLQVLLQTDGKVLEAVEQLVRLNSGNAGGAGIKTQKSGGSANPFEALDRELPPLPPGAVEVGGKSAGLTPTIYQTQPQLPTPTPTPQSAPSTSYGTGVDSWFQVPAGQWRGYQVTGHSTGPQQSPTNPYYNGGAMFASMPLTPGMVNGGVGSGMFAATPTTPGYNNPFMSTSAPPGHNPYQPPPQQNQLQQQQLLQQQQIQQQQAQQQQQQAQQQQQQLQQAQQQQQQLQQAQQQQLQQQAQQQQQLQQQQLQQQQLQQQQLQQQYLQSQLQPQQPLWTQPHLHSPQPNPYQSQLLQQRTGGVDKSAILALFNYPHLAPPPNSNPVLSSPPPIPQQKQENSKPPPHMERSASAPSAGSNNPFLPQQQQGPGVGMGHRSQESVDFGAWQSGRHSPDAFASLSFGQ